ncbi:uncharacterized protein IWZ02DRAFT_2310 [Phyllosticta citriasiana]|uniref:Uncharacterized protein n=1 Tax=Phyllosticta citriasiana TaxID=595635 RepID=A0ABR1KG09_9PEZI
MVSLFLLLFGRRRSVCCHASSTEYLRSAVLQKLQKKLVVGQTGEQTDKRTDVRWMDGWMRDGLTDRDENSGMGRHDDGNTGEVFRLNSFRHCRCCCCRHCFSRPLGTRVESSQFVSSGAVVVVAVLGSVPLGWMMAMDGIGGCARASLCIYSCLSICMPKPQPLFSRDRLIHLLASIPVLQKNNNSGGVEGFGSGASDSGTHGAQWAVIVVATAAAAVVVVAVATLVDSDR